MRLVRVSLILLLGLLLLFTPALPRGGAGFGSHSAHPSGLQVSVSEDERQLERDLQAEDGTALLAFFRKRTPSATEAEHLRVLIRQLGHDSLPLRDRALYELLARGRSVRGLLRQATHDPDPEIAERAGKGLAALERGDERDHVTPAVRLLGEQKALGTVPVLLGWLPFADTPAASDAALSALSNLAMNDGRVDSAFLLALSDPEPLRRAAAATALLRAQAPDAAALAHKLLLDPEPEVRWRVAVALVEAQDSAAVPVLIDLLGELGGDQQDKVEALLVRLAGPRTPAAPRGTDAESRRRCRDAWMGWWRDHADAVDLTKIPEPPRPAGETLVLQMALRETFGEGLIIKPNGEATPPLFSLAYPIALQALPEGRWLTAQYGQARGLGLERFGEVTERDRLGDVVWKYTAPGPVVAAQRLASGLTFVATRDKLLEIDSSEQTQFVLSRPRRDIAAAREALNGHFVAVTLTGLCQHLDREGHEVGRFPVGRVVVGAGIDVSPTRRVLVPEYEQDRVAEYDPDGRLCWQAQVKSPTAVVRLPDGRTLAASTTTGTIVELDRRGFVVWQFQASKPVMAIGRR